MSTYNEELFKLTINCLPHLWTKFVDLPLGQTRLDELEARCAPTKHETPKKPRPITDQDVLALFKEQKRLIDSLRARIEKLEARRPRFGWARG